MPTYLAIFAIWYLSCRSVQVKWKLISNNVYEHRKSRYSASLGVRTAPQCSYREPNYGGHLAAAVECSQDNLRAHSANDWSATCDIRNGARGACKFPFGAEMLFATPGCLPAWNLLLILTFVAAAAADDLFVFTETRQLRCATTISVFFSHTHTLLDALPVEYVCLLAMDWRICRVTVQV